MTEERYREICGMSMEEFRSLSAREQKRFMKHPMPDERRREVMLGMYRRSLN
jgi:hypothetical protein